jgi:hypothetical protein
VSEKVELSEKLTAVDQNVRELWDAMDAEQQKSLKQELFILNRYISCAAKPDKHWQKGKTPTVEEQKHFVTMVNNLFNKNWFLLAQKHPKLMWILLCMCSYDGKTEFFHQYITPKKKEGSNSKKVKFLAEIYPNRKMDEIEMLADLTTDKELKALAKTYGMEDSIIAKKLK